MRQSICMKAFNVYQKPAYPSIDSTYYNNSYQKYMPLKVCDFYWACSRKSYLPCGQSYDIASYDSIVQCMAAGARLINLDIYPDLKDPNTPVVRNSTMMPYIGVALDLGKCLGLIATNAWKESSEYPMILYLSINSMNPVLFQNISKMIKKYLGNNLINKKYGFNGRNGLFPFSQIPIADMKGRIGIITDKYPTIESLNEFIHGSTVNNDVISVHMYSADDQNYGGINVKNSDVSDLITFNKDNITLVDTPDTVSLTNMHNPKIDLVNPEPTDCWKYGCQLVLMNYQLFDDNMETYIAKFKNGSLQLKPDNLRDIPQLPKPIVKQNTQLYYAPRTKTQTGWYSFNI